MWRYNNQPLGIHPKLHICIFYLSLCGSKERNRKDRKKVLASNVDDTLKKKKAGKDKRRPVVYLITIQACIKTSNEEEYLKMI